MSFLTGVITLAIGLLAGLGAGFFMGRKHGWHNGCSRCLDAYGSALGTINAALSFWKGEEPPPPSKVIHSLCSEYQEELEERGIWVTPPSPARKVPELWLPDLEDDELLERVEADALEEELGPDWEPEELLDGETP